PTPTLFPYPTLFRSRAPVRSRGIVVDLFENSLILLPVLGRSLLAHNRSSTRCATRAGDLQAHSSKRDRADAHYVVSSPNQVRDLPGPCSESGCHAPQRSRPRHESPRPILDAGCF